MAIGGAFGVTSGGGAWVHPAGATYSRSVSPRAIGSSYSAQPSSYSGGVMKVVDSGFMRAAPNQIGRPKVASERVISREEATSGSYGYSSYSHPGFERGQSPSRHVAIQGGHPCGRSELYGRPALGGSINGIHPHDLYGGRARSSSPSLRPSAQEWQRQFSPGAASRQLVPDRPGQVGRWLGQL